MLPSPVFLYHLREQTVCIPIRLQTVKRIRGTLIPVARFLLNKMHINQKSIAEPTPDMIIFFDCADESGQDGLSDHTGIVQKVENGRVYTVEGNSGDSVRQNGYPIGYYEILGYGAHVY